MYANSTIENEQKISTFFTECELESVEEYDFLDYDRLNLKTLENGECFSGKPHLSEVETYTFDDDGTEKTNHRAHLFIVDDEAEEYLDIKINLKQDGDVQKNVHKLSTLFRYVTGILEFENPGRTVGMNRIRTINLQQFREFTNNCNFMEIEVETVNGANFPYNSFKIKKIEN